MHEVHTFIRRDVLPVLACTTWMLGLKRRGVRRCEKETLLPKPGPLPQMSQTEATGSLLSEIEERMPPRRRPGQKSKDIRPGVLRANQSQLPRPRSSREPRLGAAARPVTAWPASAGESSHPGSRTVRPGK